MPFPFSPGDIVSARGRVWRLRGFVDHGACVALDLDPGGGQPDAQGHVLLYPFDRVARLPDAGLPLFVSRRRWSRAIAARLLDLDVCDALRSPLCANLHLLPYQLEPAMAMAIHGIPRVLIADAVGLGKTIQAGITITELFARSASDRALIIVPAGLRDQWASELRHRFSLDADVIDGTALRDLATTIPRTINPWTVPRVAIVSMDFAKRPEVIPALSAVRWDIVVIDEAHVITTDTDRYRAMSMLARRAPRLLLLTATPHSGDVAAFEALTALGATDAAEPMMMFRRSRTQVGLAGPRRVRLLGVRLGVAELRTLRVLINYARRVWRYRDGPESRDARLAMMLLLKRALSSPSSLLVSVTRRRALLEVRDDRAPSQLDLPLDDEADGRDEEPSATLGARGLARPDEEQAWLDDIASAATFGAREHRKVRAVQRLLRRVREPAIVFTEYRDTLRELETALAGTRRCVCLHGGMDRVERNVTLSAFSSGEADVLLATDAGGAGLNLHLRCRLVINLELPWNPVRLEQRIGRVDRIGQSRTVHAIQIVGRATPESRVLTRVMARFDRARAAMGDEGTLWKGAPADHDTAEAMLGLRLPATLWKTKSDAGKVGEEAALTTRCDLSCEAAVEAVRLQSHRALVAAVHRGSPHSITTLAHHRGHVPTAYQFGRGHGRCVVSTVRVRPRGTGGPPRVGVGPGILAVFDVRLVDSHGHVWDELLVPLHLDAHIGRPASRREARALLQRLVSEIPEACATFLHRAITSRLTVVQVCADERAWGVGARIGIEDEGAADTDPIYQAGLFDRRAERSDHTESRGQPLPIRSSIDGLASTSRSHTITSAGPPRLAGLLMLTR